MKRYLFVYDQIFSVSASTEKLISRSSKILTFTMISG